MSTALQNREIQFLLREITWRNQEARKAIGELRERQAMSRNMRNQMKPGHCCILLYAWKSKDFTLLGCRAGDVNACQEPYRCEEPTPQMNEVKKKFGQAEGKL